MKVISPEQAFERLRQPEKLICIDVRSEDEFHEGHFSGVVNIPILNNEHRHQVGLTYKQQGQDIAIQMGHQLVDPLKPQLIAQWQQASQNQEVLVYCWRGGLRSKISCQWMQENQIANARVEGGYKALRAIVRRYFSQAWKLVVVTGMTGSQKTEIIKRVPNHVDLEGLANHRGSAFGLLIQTQQPRQGTFENNLSVALSHVPSQQHLILEDESRLVGDCVVPPDLYSQMAQAPLVLVESSVQARAEHIFTSYVQLSLAKAERGKVREHFQSSLLRISRKLGGLLTDQLLKVMSEAFFHNDADLHKQWIESLLVNYYDKMYLHSFNKKGRPVVFSGSREEVEAYLKQLNA